MFISRLANDGREQQTAEHLKETAAYASIIGAKFRLSAFARAAAMFHDMGKLSNTFTQYLRASVQSKKDGMLAPQRGSVIHATQGAKYIYETFMSKKELFLAAEIVAICIAGHHGRLMDGISPQGETPLRNRLTTDNDSLHFEEVKSVFEEENVLSENVMDLICACHNELLSCIDTCKANNLNPFFMIHMLVKSVFSCLVDSDRYNAYCFEIGIAPEQQISVPPWEEYSKRLEEYYSTFTLVSEIDHLRHKISEDCLRASDRQRGIYRLAVPTGGGKTLSSLRFALNHAKEHNMERIIYIIPYLSVLEQTAKEIKKALKCRSDEDFILEHHSNLVLPDDENEVQARRLLIDRWSKPIVITTMVQFLESIYSHKGGDLRKLHNMSKAVFIFDEVQSLPVKCVYLFNDALNYLQTFGNCTALLCTATQPLLDKVKQPIHLASHPELIADTSKMFEKLKRTRIVDSIENSGYTIKKLSEFVLNKLNEAGNCLVILNTKNDVAKLYREVKNCISANKDTDIKLVHLSTSMCPAHRLDAIDAMMEDGKKRRLKDERILCISTQLIEAGVDVSFGCVVRALAGLDSIAQAAGRCNRNGEDPEGREVYVVNLAEENLSMLPDIKCGSEITRRIFNESAGDLLSQATMDRYYEEYFYKREGEMNFRNKDGNIYDLLSCNKKGLGAYKNFGNKSPLPMLRHAFQTAGEQFFVIERNTTSVLVPYNRGIELANNYNVSPLKDKSRLLHEISRYSVTLYKYQLDKLQQEGALCRIGDEIIALDGPFYDNELGVVFQQDPEFFYI